MSKHTPGPWSVIKHYDDVFIDCGDPNAQYICEVLGGYKHYNARLIAAAPKILTELRKANSIIEQLWAALCKFDNGTNVKWPILRQDPRRTAIAAAEGNASE